MATQALHLDGLGSAYAPKRGQARASGLDYQRERAKVLGVPNCRSHHPFSLEECRSWCRTALLATEYVTGIDVINIIAPSHVVSLVMARRMYWVVLLHHGYPVTHIAEMVGRNHSTVIVGLDIMKQGSTAVKDEVRDIESRIQTMLRQEQDNYLAYHATTSDVMPPTSNALRLSLNKRLSYLQPQHLRMVFDYLRGPLLGISQVTGVSPALGLVFISSHPEVIKTVDHVLSEFGCAPYMSVLTSHLRKLDHSLPLSRPTYTSVAL